jgi:hypothetical protein
MSRSRLARRLGLVALAVPFWASTSCGVPRGVVATSGGQPAAAAPPTTFPTDATYEGRCPAIPIAQGEYARLTVVSAHHADPHMLVSGCDEKTLSGCVSEFCSPTKQSQSAACVSPDESNRRLYSAPAAADQPAAGTVIIAEPFCFAGVCELFLALWVPGAHATASDTDCRLLAGQIHFEDHPLANGMEDFNDLVLDCEVRNDDGTIEPRECYKVH